MKMMFILLQIILVFTTKVLHLASLALKMRFLGTRKWSIESNYYIINVLGIAWFRIIMFIERLCAQTCSSNFIFKQTVHPFRVCVTNKNSRAINLVFPSSKEIKRMILMPA